MKTISQAGQTNLPDLARIGIALVFGGAAVLLGLRATMGATPIELILGLFLFYIVLALTVEQLVLLLLVFHISVNFFLRVSPTVALNLVEIILLALFVAQILRQLVSGRVTLPASRLAWAVAVYSASSVFLLLNSFGQEDALKGVVRGFEYWAAFLVFVRTLKTPGRLKHAMIALVISSIFVGLLSWYQRLAFTATDEYLRHIEILIRLGLIPRIPEWLPAFFLRHPIIRVGANIDPGGLATGILLPPTLLLVVLAIWHLCGRSKIVLYALTVLLGGALVFTLARSGIYAFAAGLLIAAYLTRRRKFILMIIFAAAVLLVALLLMPESYTIQRILSSTGDSISSDRGRIAYISQSSRIASASPLVGVGLGGLGHGPGRVVPHNQFLQDFIAKGIISMVALLAVFALAFRRGFLLSRQIQDPFLRFSAIWATAVVVSYALHSVAHPPLLEIQYGALFWLAVAVIEVLPRLTRSAQAEN